MKPRQSVVGERPQLGVLYEITASLTGLNELNAPFLNFANVVPFVVQPSGKIFKMGHKPYSLSFYR